jgi:hypothetical protein
MILTKPESKLLDKIQCSTTMQILIENNQVALDREHADRCEINKPRQLPKVTSYTQLKR